MLFILQHWKDEERSLLSWYHLHSPMPRSIDLKRTAVSTRSGHGEQAGAVLLSHLAISSGSIRFFFTGCAYGPFTCRPLSACRSSRYSSLHSFSLCNCGLYICCFSVYLIPCMSDRISRLRCSSVWVVEICAKRIFPQLTQPSLRGKAARTALRKGEDTQNQARSYGDSIQANKKALYPLGKDKERYLLLWYHLHSLMPHGVNLSGYGPS